MSWPLEAIDVMLLKLLLTTFAVLLGYRLYRSHLNHRLHKNEDVICAGYEIVPGTLTQSAGGRGLILSAHLRPRTSHQVASCAKLGQDYKELLLELYEEDENRLRWLVQDTAKRRWQVPERVFRRPGVIKKSTIDVVGGRRKFTVEVTETLIAIKRLDGLSTESLFSLDLTLLVFKEQFIQWVSAVPLDANIYGLGEISSSFRRDPNNTRQAIWTRDIPTPPEENLYGAHPFHMEIRDRMVTHGVFLLNSNAMDILLRPGKIIYRVLGGVFDFYIMLGPSPVDVSVQYSDIVGRTALMPLWSFGWHQCRWGYRTIEDVKDVVNNYKLHKIPLETMWIDIDYMDAYKVFTYDPERYALAGVRALRQQLNEHHQHLVLIVDPGVKVEQGYSVYEDGIESGIFLRNPRVKGTQNWFVGDVWPGRVTFPDWFHPNSTAWWLKHMREWMNTIDLDGIWIDMNEVANFCTGDCTVDIPKPGEPFPNYQSYIGLGDYASSFDPHWPGYKIDNGGSGKELDLHHRTTSMDATHYGGILEYFAHNVYGHMEAQATRESLLQIRPKKRPFILSRSTFSGSGRYTAHWLGDNWSTWESMRASIPGILNFAALFSIPMVGSDICGFIGNATEELCIRWTQFGALAYPFARNHNDIKGTPQEPYRWSSVTSVAQKTLRLRYKMIPYWYTLFARAHLFGLPVLQPTAWLLNADSMHKLSHETLKEFLADDMQVVIGDAFLITPALHPSVTEVSALFPPESDWYDLRTGKKVSRADDTERRVTVSAPVDGIAPIFLRGGCIIPHFADSVLKDIEPLNIHDIAKARLYSLHAAVDVNDMASGMLYLDQESFGIDDGSAVYHIFIELSLQKQENDEGTAIIIQGKIVSLSGDYKFMPTITISSIQMYGFKGDNRRTAPLLVQQMKPIDPLFKSLSVKLNGGSVAVERFENRDELLDITLSTAQLDLTRNWEYEIIIN